MERNTTSNETPVGTVVGHRVRAPSVAAAAWLLALSALAITVAVGTLHLRVHLRDHLAQRDGEVLTAVALARQYANGSGSNLTQRIGNAADQLALALEISQLKEGVLGVRLFDRDGQFETGFPATLTATNLSTAAVSSLRELRPVSRFLPEAKLADYFLVLPDAEANQSRSPLLEVTIPLHARGHSQLAAAAQLVLDGRTLAGEYARVDEHLWLLGIGLYLGGAVLLSGVLFWAYRRLRKAQALVEERTARLLRANHELALAAKTSALGSVTAHLVHGLSNPLANLQDFIASHRNGAAESDVQSLAASTRRMQQLVSGAVGVLAEEHGGDQYQLSLAELVDVLNAKLATAVQDRGTHFITVLDAGGELSNRHANLILLILENLLHNALKFTPPRGIVTLRFHAVGDQVHCDVADQGTGIASENLPRLFTPCRSTHGGSGIGLAISKQLANQLGAKLELKANSASGCVFTLSLPNHLFAEEDLRAATVNAA